jgi:hypothetical protein
MAAGGFTQLRQLRVHKVHTYREDHHHTWPFEKLAAAFSRLPHLEHLSLMCYRIPLSIVATSLKSLVKAKLKTLFLSHVGAEVEPGNEWMLASVFEGFHNLESLELQYLDSKREFRPPLVPYAVAQMERGEFPRLHTLRIRFCRLRESDACKIFKAICHGHLPCLTSLDLSGNNLGFSIVDDAIRAMPHLKSLTWWENFDRKPQTLAELDRLRTAAAAYVDLELIIMGAY